jgi:hypothetical protein
VLRQQLRQALERATKAVTSRAGWRNRDAEPRKPRRRVP